MRLFPLLTLSIAPCGVLGWYGTQKLMAETIQNNDPEASPVNVAGSQLDNLADGPLLEQLPMADVKPGNFISQPKFSSPKPSVSKSVAADAVHVATGTPQTVQGSFTLSVTTNALTPVKIDRDQVRQVVSQSTQSALAALSLGPSALAEADIVASNTAEELDEIITAEVTDILNVDETPQEAATAIDQSVIAAVEPEVAIQPQADGASLANEVSPAITAAIADQAPLTVASPEAALTAQLQLEQSVAVSDQSFSEASVEQLEIEQFEEPDPDLAISTIDLSDISASDIPSLDSAETDEILMAAARPEIAMQPQTVGMSDVAEVSEPEISESLTTAPLIEAGAPLPDLNFSREAPQVIAQQPSAAALSPFISENYILGPGDVIAVNVFNVPDYSGQHSIAADGSITLPQLGRVLIHSLTVQQASEEIAARYAYTLESPLVSVQVVQQRPVQVAIAGEIIQPGLYTVSPQGTPYPRLFTALQQAGGLTQAADIRQVEVRRRTVNGEQTTLRVDLFALLNEGDISQNIFLQDGDTIMIPSAEIVDMEALDQLSASNLRNNVEQPIDVAIVGEVNQPGPYRLGSEGGRTTVVQALQQAGGITPSANLRDIQLRRKTRQGDDQFFEVNLWKLLQTGDLSQDLVLQQGDTLVIPTAPDVPIPELIDFTNSTLSTGSIQVSVLGEVESPGAQQVRASTSLNQAILAAGGLNRRTRGRVTLVRFNPDGTVSQQPIKVDLSQEINEETNPILRPNDVILVGRSAKAAFDDTIRDFSGTFNLIWPLLLLGL